MYAVPLLYVLLRNIYIYAAYLFDERYIYMNK